MAKRIVADASAFPNHQKADAAAAYGRFMTAVLQPVGLHPQQERMLAAETFEELTAGDLIVLLRAAMLQEGVQPLSTADSVHAHLRERVEDLERRVACAPVDAASRLTEAINVLGETLGSLEQYQRDVVGAGMKSLVERPESSGSLARTITALVAQWRRE